MRRVRILQIGDIHYPEWQTNQSRLDAKDKKFARGIADGLRRSAFSAILRKIAELGAMDECHGIAFVGDFTTNGQSEFLEGVFRHFSLLCRGNKLLKTPLLFVPGNHDVNRADARALGRIQKFRSMAKLAEKYQWEPVPQDTPVHIRLQASGQGLQITLLNTAIGSWELHNLPEFLRDKLRTADANTLAVDLGFPTENQAEAQDREPGGVSGTLVDQYYGQLDTPYMLPQMLDAVQRNLEETDGKYAVLVGHHNLLPQKIPRISPYGEMLNAGSARSQILGLNRPVVYLHGHIHQDPVEVVSDPRLSDSNLILISAPEIKDGFNELVFYLSDQDDLVGVRLIPYRAKPDDGTLVEANHCFISTLSPSRAIIDNKTFDLLRRLRQHREERGTDLFFWSEILQLVGPAEWSDSLEDALIMLHASHAVEIDDLNKPNRSWRIQLKGK